MGDHLFKVSTVVTSTITATISTTTTTNNTYTTTTTTTTGHCNDELWGLATHPTKPFFATTGDDYYLRFFDIRSRRCIGSVKIGKCSVV